MSSQVATLVKAARRFGTDCILETGVEMGLTFDELVTLQTELFTIEDEIANARRFSRAKKRRVTPEQAVRRLLGLDDEEEGS